MASHTEEKKSTQPQEPAKQKYGQFILGFFTGVLYCLVGMMCLAIWTVLSPNENVFTWVLKGVRCQLEIISFVLLGPSPAKCI